MTQHIFSKAPSFYILDDGLIIADIFFNSAFNDRCFPIFLIYWRIRKKKYTEFMQWTVVLLYDLDFFKFDTFSELLMYTVKNNKSTSE